MDQLYSNDAHGAIGFCLDSMSVELRTAINEAPLGTDAGALLYLLNLERAHGTQMALGYLHAFMQMALKSLDA